MSTFVLFFLCFKQKTAYEMRISDWSSDVCSSDLVVLDELSHEVEVQLAGAGETDLDLLVAEPHEQLEHDALALGCHRIDERLVAVPQVDRTQIGRASCRERVCQYV